MLGFLLGVLKNFIFVGYSIVEAFVFMVAFNYLAPEVLTWGVNLPVSHFDYWTCLAIFILVHFFGQFINKLFPKFASINQAATNKNE